MTKRTKSKTEKANQLKQELLHFTGDLVRYRHPFNRRVLFTPGIQHVAEVGDAYWLIDAIASWIGTKTFQKAIKSDSRIGSLHFWTLEVDLPDETATLQACADLGEKPFIKQSISYTDFPLEKISIWAGFDGEHWVLYLPSEH